MTFNKEHFKKYWLAYAAVALTIFVVIGNYAGWFKGFKGLKEGDKCVRDGQQGTITNGVCTVMGGPRPTGGGNGGGGNGGGASAARTGY